jgi:hypothetical protein
MAELDASLKPISTKPINVPTELKDNSQEDARCFLHQNALWISWTVSQYPTQEHKSIVAYGKLIEGKDSWTISGHHIPDYGRNTFEATEKNWVFLSCENKLFALYLTYEEQVWIELEGARVEEVHKSKALRWPYAEIHGGAICDGQNGNLLHFFNSHTAHRDRSLDRYLIGVAELAGQPPFEVLRISTRPVLAGEEGVNLDKSQHFKCSVVFCCGAMKVNDNEWLASVGINDSKCALVKLNPSHLFL